MNHPLASLVGPLRYACRSDFAHLSTVKDLRGLLERALAGATGVDAEALKHLRAALPHVDHPTPDRRKAALRRVVAGLKLSGVPLPEELAQVAISSAQEPTTAPVPSGEVRSEGRPERVPEWKSTAPVPPPPGTRTAAPRAAVEGYLPPQAPRPGAVRGPNGPMLASSPAPEEKPAGKRKKRVAKGQEESRAEAKLLSIAPRSGPLSIPLRTWARGWTHGCWRR